MASHSELQASTCPHPPSNLAFEAIFTIHFPVLSPILTFLSALDPLLPSVPTTKFHFTRMNLILALPFVSDKMVVYLTLVPFTSL